MLTEIREKTQGTFAWIILILICVPFALWGLQNYTNGGQEKAVVIVGDKEFGQREVNQAYAQFKQQYAEMQIPEEILQKQAIEKLIRDELLLQHVTEEGLVVTDERVRQFIASLQYFQREGKFDKQQYETLLASQGMSSAQFINRIRKALVMEQFQKAVTDTSFISEQDMQRFFKIQNQTRDIEYVTINIEPVATTPSDAAINDFYQQHASDYQTAEQVSVEYVELSLNDLMQDVTPSDEQLQAYYADNIEQYSTKERRKISHILFAKTKDTTEAQALEKAKAAVKRLQQESFAELAKELSDDTLTAKNGGDLGLFEVGVMEPAFEEAASQLALGEVSAPVKSAFGYHIITVTELEPAATKPYAKVAAEVEQALKRAAAETTYYELGESLTELSFENSDSLSVVSDDLGLKIKQTALFSRDAGTGLATEEAIRNMAFSESVLQGHNSEPVELGEERVVVLRMLEHQPAETKPLEAVKDEIITAIKIQQAKDNAKQLMATIKQKLLAGQAMADIAKEQGLLVKKAEGVTREGAEINWQVKQAVFKAAKPVAGKPTVVVVDLPQGGHTIVSLLSVTEGGAMEDKEKAKLAKANIAKALGQADYAAVIAGIREGAHISIRE